MEYKNLWPTTLGFGKFDSLELSQYILLNYDMNNPPSDMDGKNIFNDHSSYMQKFQNDVYNAFNTYLKENFANWSDVPWSSLWHSQQIGMKARMSTWCKR